MFQIKDFLSVTAGMINQVRSTTGKLTDFTVGSVTRTMLEAVAIEIDQLYQRMLAGLLEGIAVAVYRSFDFERLPALPASGLVTLSPLDGAAAQDIAIPQGTTLATAAGLHFVTAAAATLAAGGASVEVLATAVQPGAAGNVLPNEISRIVSAVPQGLAVVNRGAFTGGRAEESDDERRRRFVEYVRSLARGTVASLAYAARGVSRVDPVSGLLVERVARVTIDESVGHVTVHVHNGAGATSAELIARVQRAIDGERDLAAGTMVPGFRPAGMRVEVVAMAERAVDVTLVAQAAAPGAELERRIAAAVAAVIRATASGGATGLRPPDMINAALLVPGVAGIDILSPTTVTPCGLGEVLAPGAITVQWAG